MFSKEAIKFIVYTGGYRVRCVYLYCILYLFRWDFDTPEEYSEYMSSREALPKAAFQYGNLLSRVELYRIFDLPDIRPFLYLVSGRISGFLCRISGWQDSRISVRISVKQTWNKQNCFKTFSLSMK